MVPSYTTLKHVQRDKVNLILSKYGKTRKNREEHGMYESVGIPVYPEFMERLEWEEHEEEEFKTLFLLLALEMLLCPALSSRLATDLVPALTCSVDSVQYDWCTLVMSKLLQSVRSFARQFYSYGHASGWGGCILFAVVFYLDRLDREAVDWGNFPRLKVWIMKEISLASKEDKSLMGGDYGCAGTLDVAYGETNPRQARDTDGPGVETQFFVMVVLDDDIPGTGNRKRRHGATSSKFPHSKVDKGEGMVCSNIKLHLEEMVPSVSLGKTTLGYDATRCKVDDLWRLISKGSLALLRRMTSMLLGGGTWMLIGGLPVLLASVLVDVVPFGGGRDAKTVVLPSLANFIDNPSCRVLAVVSEVSLGCWCICTVGECMCNWIFVLAVMDFILVSSSSPRL